MKTSKGRSYCARNTIVRATETRTAIHADTPRLLVSSRWFCWFLQILAWRFGEICGKVSVAHLKEGNYGLNFTDWLLSLKTLTWSQWWLDPHLECLTFWKKCKQVCLSFHRCWQLKWKGSNTLIQCRKHCKEPRVCLVLFFFFVTLLIVPDSEKKWRYEQCEHTGSGSPGCQGCLDAAQHPCEDVKKKAILERQ